MASYTWSDAPRQTAFPIAAAGYPFIAAAAFVTAVFALLGMSIPALLGMGATACICLFFRDPDRVIPNEDGAVVSPADGKVIVVEKVTDPRFYDGPCMKISIFMSVLNVHVNRVPFGGNVTSVDYHPGKFLVASADKASDDNERNAITVETEAGKRYCVVQIAGLIARRIISRLQTGDAVRRGQRFGLICFGSRLDLYLPPDFSPAVNVGDRVRSGSSVIGTL